MVASQGKRPRAGVLAATTTMTMTTVAHRAGLHATGQAMTMDEARSAILSMTVV
jgi:hypothetical protein